MSRKLLSLALIFAVLAICALSVGGLAASAGGAAANFELARAVQAQAEANEAQAHALTAQAISDIAGDLLLVIVIIFGFGAKAAAANTLARKNQTKQVTPPQLSAPRTPHTALRTPIIYEIIEEDELWGSGWQNEQ